MQAGNAVPLKTFDPIGEFFPRQPVAFDDVGRGYRALAKGEDNVAFAPRCPAHITLRGQRVPDVGRVVQIIVSSLWQHDTPSFGYQPYELGVFAAARRDPRHIWLIFSVI